MLVLASRSLPKKYTDGLGPWDLSLLEPYQPEYLAGFRAEGYTVTLEDGYKEATEYVNRMIERDVKFDIGGDRQRVEHIDTNLSDMTYNHILVPVWIAACKFRGRSFRFVVNGQSGQVTGERPWSAIKLAIAFICAIVLALLVAYLYAQGQYS